MDGREFEELFEDAVRSTYGIAEVTDDLVLSEGFHALGDSLDRVEFVMECERVFNIDEVPDATVNAWRTVGDARRFFRGHLEVV